MNGRIILKTKKQTTMILGKTVSACHSASVGSRTVHGLGFPEPGYDTSAPRLQGSGQLNRCHEDLEGSLLDTGYFFFYLLFMVPKLLMAFLLEQELKGEGWGKSIDQSRHSALSSQFCINC